MKAEQARKITEDGFTKLAEALERGSSAELMDLLAASARFHKYSFSNVLLIVSQCPEATHVAGFQTWKSFGRHVKQGEKGIAIIAPMLFKNDDTEAKKSDETSVRFRVVHVFDVSQTDGEPLPELTQVAGDPGEYLERLKGIIQSDGIQLEFCDLDGAHGVSRGGAIAIQQGLAASETFSVLVHEYAHELLHRVPLEDRPSKIVRETEAEAVAFIVDIAVGLIGHNASADYITLYGGSKETLMASLHRVQRTACRVIEALLK